MAVSCAKDDSISIFSTSIAVVNGIACNVSEERLLHDILGPAVRHLSPVSICILVSVSNHNTLGTKLGKLRGDIFRRVTRSDHNNRLILVSSAIAEVVRVKAQTCKVLNALELWHMREGEVTTCHDHIVENFLVAAIFGLGRNCKLLACFIPLDVLDHGAEPNHALVDLVVLGVADQVVAQCKSWGVRSSRCTPVLLKAVIWKLKALFGPI